MNVTINSLKPTILYNELPWLDQKSLASNSKVKTRNGLVDSLVFGWKASNATWWAHTIFSNILDSTQTLRSSMYVGIGCAVSNLAMKTSSDQNEVPTGKIKAMVKSVFQGGVDGIVVFNSLTMVLSLFTRHCQVFGMDDCRLKEKIGFASILIAGVAQTISSYRARSEKASIQARPPNCLANAIKSYGEGILAAIATIASAVTTNILKDTVGLHILQKIILSSSAVSAIASTIERYYFNSSKSPASEKTFRKDFMNSFLFGWKSYGLCYLTSGAIAVAYSLNSRSGNYVLEPYILKHIAGSALFATALAIINFLRRSDANDITYIGKIRSIPRWACSKMAQNWKTASKLKKSGIILASLTALTTLGILYVGPENAQVMGKKAYDTVLFTETTETTTKTIGEWIKGYSDFDEMTRLASLTEDNDYRNFAEVSCAEILQTCHLNKDATAEHKRIYREKALKFHPDKYKNSDDLKQLAEKAMTALGRAQEMIKNQKECSGQEEDSCLNNETEQTITRILKQPRLFFEKVMGVSQACFFQIDDQEPIQTSLDYCKDMSS